MPKQLQPLPNRLRILQINLNKSEKVHLDLLNGLLGTKWDVVLIQEPHVTKYQMICTPRKFQQVYPADRWKWEASIGLSIWVNLEIDMKSWKIISIPNTNDVTAIQLQGPYGKLTIFNIYNSGTHSRIITALQWFLHENTNEIWHGQNCHMMWCRYFNRHHPLWDRDEDTHLFTTEALNNASQLIKLLAEHLPKGVPLCSIWDRDVTHTLIIYFTPAW
jgi:hypothetical protein